MSWRVRRQNLDAIAAAVNTLPDELVHIALMGVDSELHRDVDEECRNTVRQHALSMADFETPPLARLSSNGQSAHVDLVRHTSSLSSASTARNGQLLVIKTLDRRWAFRMRAQQFPAHELAILKLGRQVPPAPIPKLIALFLTDSALHVVLEFAQGGDLLALLEAHADTEAAIGLREDWVQRWVAEVVEAVEWLHQADWAHRDIKPQNLLLQASGRLLLTDFGSAAPISIGSRGGRGIARKFCRALNGTPDYIAPEILKHAESLAREWDFDDDDSEKAHQNGLESQQQDELRDIDDDDLAYGAQCDWWSLGVTVFELLYGQAPFFAQQIAATYDRIVNFESTLLLPVSAGVSSEARSFIQSLLVRAERRPAATAIKEHAWLKAQPFGRLHRVPPVFIPSPFVPPSPASPVQVQHSGHAANFNFDSAFFSSPGLSILRPSPRDGPDQNEDDDEEAAYWRNACFTFMPPADVFEVEDQDVVDQSRQITSPGQTVDLHPPATSARAASPFETPVPRHRTHRHIMTSTPAPPPGSSSARTKRNVSDVEAWRAMQERAWEVGTTARKNRGQKSDHAQSRSRSEGSNRGLHAEGHNRSQVESVQGVHESEEDVKACRGERGGESLLELEGIERRRRGLVHELDGIEEKYRGLFALALGQRDSDRGVGEEAT